MRETVSHGITGSGALAFFACTSLKRADAAPAGHADGLHRQHAARYPLHPEPAKEAG
jgi:hypothetical protein